MAHLSCPLPGAVDTGAGLLDYEQGVNEIDVLPTLLRAYSHNPAHSIIKMALLTDESD
jgi:hypothetical protein